MDRAKARDYCRQLSETVRAMALGIREGGSGQRLMTFHPSGVG